MNHFCDIYSGIYHDYLCLVDFDKFHAKQIICDEQTFSGNFELSNFAK